MVPTSTAASLSILEDGELKPGIYKIQNISSKTFLDYEVHTRELCCRLVNELEEDKGLVSWAPFLLRGSCLKVRSGK